MFLKMKTSILFKKIIHTILINSRIIQKKISFPDMPPFVLFSLFNSPSFFRDGRKKEKKIFVQKVADCELFIVEVRMMSNIRI